MINQEYCNDPNLLSIFFFIKNVMNIVKIVVPILLIVMSMMDVLKVVVGSDKDNKVLTKKTVDRFISAAFVFLVMSMMDIVLSLFGVQSIGLTSCWTGATRENIAVLKEAEKEADQKRIEAEKDLVSAGKDKNGEVDLELREKLKKATSSSSSSGTSNGPTSDGTLSQASGTCVKNYVISSKETIVNEALKYVGNPYVYGGNSLTNGIDCSGFTQQIMQKFGASITRTAESQAFDGAPVASLAEAQPGDLIVYSGHVAIYDGKGGIVHASNPAPYPQGGIKTSPNAQYNTILAIRRIIC